MGFGKGAAGTNGTGFMLLVILFVELFAVSLGQLYASISPSIQVRGETIILYGNVTDSVTDRCSIHAVHHGRSFQLLWCYYHVPYYGAVLQVLALPG